MRMRQVPQIEFTSDKFIFSHSKHDKQDKQDKKYFHPLSTPVKTPEFEHSLVEPQLDFEEKSTLLKSRKQQLSPQSR